MSETQEIKDLAENLKQKGLASSMSDALEKAKSIIGGINQDIHEPKIKPKPKIEITEPNPPSSTEKHSNSFNEPSRIEDPRINAINQEISALEIKNDQNQEKLIEEPYGDNYNILGDDRTLNEIMGEAKEEREEERANEAEKNYDEYSEEIQPENLNIIPEEGIIINPTKSETFQEPSQFQESQESHSYSDIHSINNLEKENSMIKNIKEDSENIIIEEPSETQFHTFTQGLMEETESDDKFNNSENFIHQKTESDSETNSENYEKEDSETNKKQKKEPIGLTDEEKEAADLTKIFNYGNK